MTQKDKELLLKDLCARLPYGVKVKDTYYNYDENSATIWLLDLNTQKVRIFADEDWQSIEYIKPYLFPMSSMTEEQHKDLHDKLIELELQALNNEISRIKVVKFEIDYYLENHFDYRGLSERGLALDASNKNIY